MPPAVILASNYDRVGGWLSDLPVADVSVKSIYPVKTGEYRGHAVIDSGSDICWVPRGFAEKYGWPADYNVGRRRVITLGGESYTPQFVLAIRINAIEWTVDACECWKGFACPIIGQNILEDVTVILEGPMKRLTMTKE
jgi:hypothetical protein